MVTYSLRRVCSGRTATLAPQTIRGLYGFYANHTATSRFLACSKVITSLAFFFNLTLNFFSETAMPQRHCKVIVRWPYGRLVMAMRWHTVLPCLGCLESRTAASRRPHGTLTVAVRQTCNNCNNREVAVQSHPGLLAVTLRFFISWIVRSSCGRCNICDHNYSRPQGLTLFKNHVL